jgi:signal transduction histidine kinase
LQRQLDDRTRECDEALEQQTATSEVLRVISSSSGELAPVFESLLASVTHLCGAEFGIILLREGDGFRAVALHGATAEYTEARWRAPFIRPAANTGLGRVLETKQVGQIADVQAVAGYVDNPVQATIVQLAGVRSKLTVPMLKEEDLIGVIEIGRQEVRPFTDKQIELVKNFAAQAVVAIENARLLNDLRQRTNELTEALEQQTATSQVLSVISSSTGELNPVFQTMLANATNICDANFGMLFRCKDGMVNAAAMLGVPPAFAEFWQRGPRRPGRLTAQGRTMETKQTVQIVDVTTDPAYVEGEPVFVAAVKLGGFRTILNVPMLKENELIGFFSIYRQEVRPFTDKQIELVKNFAAQAVIAIENARLLSELRARTDELACSVQELRALGEVGQAVNSTLDVETVLRTIVTKAVELSATDAGAIYVFDEDRREFRLRATYGMSEAMIATISDRHIGVGDASIGYAARRREPIQVADLREAPASAFDDIMLGAGYRALLVVPLLGPDRIVGALVVRRKRPGAFPQSAVDLLQTFADQSVLAIQNARLFREIEEKARELEIAGQHKSQFVANMSHELRTPLAAILGYAELMEEGIYEPLGEKSLTALARIRTNGKHLLGLINTVLDIAKIESGQFTLNMTEYSIGRVVETVRAATESLAHNKKLALTTEVAKSLPLGIGDEHRLTQVLLNLVGNAIKFTDTGEVRVTAEAVDGNFTVRVVDSGPGIPEQECTRIFEQFHQIDNSITKSKGGTGLGLAIAKQIVEMHRGRIWVDSMVGKGSTFQIELPISAKKALHDQAHPGR